MRAGRVTCPRGMKSLSEGAEREEQGNDFKAKRKRGLRSTAERHSQAKACAGNPSWKLLTTHRECRGTCQAGACSDSFLTS